MADTMQFESETARAEAIATYDESSGTPEGLAEIMSAPIVPAAGSVEGEPVKAEIKPPQDLRAPPAVTKEPTEAEIKPPQQVGAINPDSWAREKGYKSFAEAKKAFDEKEALVQRQQKFIEEKINTRPAQSEQYDALMRRNQELEQQLASTKPAAIAKDGSAAATQQQIKTTENRIGIIRQALTNNLSKRKELLAQLRGDPTLQMDADFMAKNHSIDEEKFNLDMQLADEMEGLQLSTEKTQRQLQDFTTSATQQREGEQRKQMYENEMNEMDEFVSNTAHPEFAFSNSKDSRTVEAEYVQWANKVASALYGSGVNMLRSEQERGAVAYALEKLNAKDPEVLNACAVAGIPVEPNEDIRKYLDICELLDHRDGFKKNPITGEKEQQFRMSRNPLNGQFEKTPVKFPSLEDAYQHKLAVDGVFNERIKTAYSKGGKDMLEAAQKRSAAPVTLDNASGVGNADVGMSMSPQQAIEALSKIDEQEARRRMLSGDPSLWNQYEQAMKLVGMET
jgi:hypothetical protein